MNIAKARELLQKANNSKELWEEQAAAKEFCEKYGSELMKLWEMAEKELEPSFDIAEWLDNINLTKHNTKDSKMRVFLVEVENSELNGWEVERVFASKEKADKYAKKRQEELERSEEGDDSMRQAVVAEWTVLD